jgi:chromosome segregation ATPase
MASIKRQYDTLLTSLLADHKAYLNRMRLQREATTTKAEDLMSRCARLETVVAEGTKELLKERLEKQVLEVQVEEMQSSIEQRITALRKKLNHTDYDAELAKMKQENEHLRTNVGNLNVSILYR